MIDLRDPRVQQALMGRAPCEPLTDSESAGFAGHRVLITGAGGAVGSELARTLAACELDSLTLVDHSEQALLRVERELRSRWPHVHLDIILGDVTRPRIIHAACTTTVPDLVLHAAGYSHVTTLERDLCAALSANVIGTLSVAQAARAVGARFVLMSTAKAVNPRSVVGATKHFAEMVTLAQMDDQFEPLVVRFGNVLGSGGGIAEVAMDCLGSRQPIPITHTDATRYFMTVGEAATLVLRADLLRLGGEACWLDMGPPVRIVDLVNRLMKIAKQKGVRAVPVSFVGLRPGEKLDDQLTVRGARPVRTAHARVWIGHQAPVAVDLVQRTIRALRADVSRGDGLSAMTNLCAAVPEYEPSEHARLSAGGATLMAPWSSREAASLLVA
ncbi:MAG: polysaccharide biosynthesis protein [Acidobacteriota bacterium]